MAHRRVIALSIFPPPADGEVLAGVPPAAAAERALLRVGPAPGESPGWPYTNRHAARAVALACWWPCHVLREIRQLSRFG